MAVFSSLMDWKNRVDRKSEAKRLGYVMNNHIIKGGHLSAQPMGALHDYVAIDPVTEKPAVVNFPVLKENPYKTDMEETKKLLERYRPELIILGKSMVLHKEPVAEIRKFVDEQKIPTTIMYDMAHVLGLVGDHFQNPFQEGAEIVTGSSHKTFFGPQRGVIGVNYKEEDLKYGLWKTIETRTFPGSVSNHHLGTQPSTTPRPTRSSSPWATAWAQRWQSVWRRTTSSSTTRPLPTKRASPPPAPCVWASAR